MRQYLTPIVFLAATAAFPQQPAVSQAPAAESEQAPMQTTFHVRFISGTNVYIDGGRNAGLAEGMKLILKQDPKKSAEDPSNLALEPGIIAKLKVVSVASTSAVCEIEAKARDLEVGDPVSMPSEEIASLVQKDTLGATRKYPMVASFTEGDPLDEEVREAEPRPPLPEVNQIRGRIGVDVSNIQELGQGGTTSSEYGLVFRADFTRILGTHWNLNGYWRGSLDRGQGGSQQSLQNLLNRTYLMSLSYINPESRWTAGIGRLYVPFASSLETIDGAYVGMKVAEHGAVYTFAGSTPDPTAWDYNPRNRIGGAFVNFHGGTYDNFHYSTSVGGGLNMQQWVVNRPFVFTENEFSYKRYFSLFHSMQIDRPVANPGTPAVSAGLGQSLFSARIQVHPRVQLEISDTYFRDVPTYDPTLVGTGLLDKYLYQGLNGGARISLPWHITPYFSLGKSSSTGDSKDSLNQMYGTTVGHIWKTGVTLDAKYSKFDNSFSSGTYKALMLTRDLGERFRLNVQGGRYSYNSPLASANNSNFINVMFDTNLGAKMFLESAFTTQRGGSLNYNQWITTLGYRFDNRSRTKMAAQALTSKASMP